MAQAQDLEKNATEKKLRIIPDIPGKGGCKTSATTQSVNLDTRYAFNCVFYNGRWRKATDSNTYSGCISDAGVATSRALHSYASYSLTNASIGAVLQILGHNKTNAPQDRLWNYTTGALLQRNGVNVTDGTGVAVPARFLNVKNRCFISWGVKNGTYTTNLVYDANGNIAYDVGVPRPVAAPTYTLLPTWQGTVAATNSCTWITLQSTTSGSDWASISFVNGSTQIQVSGANYTVAKFVNQNFAGPGTVTTTIGSAIATVTASWPLDGSYNGLQLWNNIGSVIIGTIGSYTVAGGTTTVYLEANASTALAGTNYTLKGEQIQLTSSYSGPSAWQASGRVFAGNLSWTTKGPQYAFARYNPTTGHISNISPIVNITEQNQSGLTVQINNIVRDGVGSAIYAAGYTQLLLFRTLIQGGSTLFALGDPTAGGVGLIPNTPAGATVFQDSYPDSTLITTLVGPLVTNAQPPVFCHQEYFDGRIFGVPVDDPTAIAYSADPQQVPFGVPEESYPSANRLRAPAADGRFLSLILVGNTLLATTERDTYYVAGNTPSTYRLIRYSTTMNGVQDYQAIEFRGEAGASTDSVVYMGADKRVYSFADGVGNSNLSLPIQNILDQYAAPASARLQQIATTAFRWIAVLLSNPGFLFIFDYQNKTWHEISMTHMPECFCTVYLSPKTPDYIFAQQGTVYQWADITKTTGVAAAYVQTNPIPFDDIDAYDQFLNCRLFVSTTVSGNWSFNLTSDEKYNFSGTFLPQPDPVRSPQPPGGNPVDAPFAGELLAQMTQVSAAPVMGHRFQFKVTWPTSTDLTITQDLYSMDVFCTNEDAGIVRSV